MKIKSLLQATEKYAFSEISWLEMRPEGIYCLPGDFYIDPAKSVPVAIISHAHADHYRSGHRSVHATSLTLALATARFRSRAFKEAHSHNFLEPFAAGPVAVTLYPSFHMDGSAMVLLEYKSQKVLYSGDINADENGILPAPEIAGKAINLLICECTFSGKPKHISPSIALQKVMDASGELPLMIGAYVLGKAQHVNRLITRKFPNLPVLLHKDILRYHQVFREMNLDVGSYQPYRSRSAKSMRKHVWIVPPRCLQGHAKNYRYFKVMASGWDYTKRWHFLDAHLEISDHAAADHIFEFICMTKAKEVAFLHGFPGGLAAQSEAAEVKVRKLRESAARSWKS